MLWIAGADKHARKQKALLFSAAEHVTLRKGVGIRRRLSKMKFLVTMDVFLSALLDIFEQPFSFKRCLGTISEWGLIWRFQVKKLKCAQHSSHLCSHLDRPGAGTSARSPAHDGWDQTGPGSCRILCWMWVSSDALAKKGFLAVFIGL